MLKVRALSTVLTNFDQPFIVDVEADPTPSNLDVYIGGDATPYTTVNLTQRFTRVTVWNTSPIASSPTNSIHSIRFVLTATGETVVVPIAYYGTIAKQIFLQPERGTVLYTRITRSMIIGDRLYYDVLSGTNVRLLNAPEHNKAFIEVYGENELGDKFYYVNRQDRILAEMGASTTLNVTLRAFKGYVPVAVYYDIPALGTLYRFSLMARSSLPSVVANFLSDVGARIAELPLATARQVSKLLGVNLNILDAGVEEGRLKVVYAVDAPPLLLVALGFIAGATVAVLATGTIRDIVALAETYAITGVLDRLASERTRAIQKVLEYAEANDLTFNETKELLSNVLEQYDSQDLNNALDARSKVKDLESQVNSLKAQRLLLGATTIGAGAVAILALRGRS